MDEDRGSGWLIFAGAILIFGGIMRIVDAIWAFRYNGAVPDALKDALLGDKLENYGWFWLIVGIVLILCGIGVVYRSQVSRWIGMIGALVAAVSAMFWMPYYPVWSLVYVAVGFLVVYGLAVHGGRSAIE
jgi:hypothetical protein